MIVTVTPNPGLDLTYVLGPEEPGSDVEVHRAESSTLEASGKGVNISRALHGAGVPTCAVLPAGGATGRHLLDLLGAAGVPCRAIAQGGDTRVNTSAIRPGRPTLKLNGPGGTFTAAEQGELLAATTTALAEADDDDPDARWLAVCGSLPPGAELDLVSQLVSVARAEGAKCVVDASGDALRVALEVGVDLVAPNRDELSVVSAAVREAADLPALAEAARGLSRSTGTHLLVSLGPDGALFTDGTVVLRAWGPPLTPVNTAGAGDALLAGWLSGQGDDLRARLARAVAWGRSACLSPTTVDTDPGAHDLGPVWVEEL